jgi:sulfotransferase 6B1
MNGSKSDLFFQAKLARRHLRRVGACLRYGPGQLARSPKFFANSFPKSGTHWLTQVLEALPLVSPAVNSGLPAVVTFDGISGRERTSDEILNDLHRFMPGDTGYGHLHARPEILSELSQSAWCTYFILRDPRDIVVSHVFYVTDIEPNHVHHAYYANVLKTFEERLRTSIFGRPDAENPFPDIQGRFMPFLGWMNQASICTLKYEDAISHPAEVIGSLVDFAISRGLELTDSREQSVQKIAEQLDPRRSPTFRQGKTGGWRKHFTPEITNLFKQVGGDLLIQLGYEKDLDW